MDVDIPWYYKNGNWHTSYFSQVHIHSRTALSFRMLSPFSFGNTSTPRRCFIPQNWHGSRLLGSRTAIGPTASRPASLLVLMCQLDGLKPLVLRKYRAARMKKRSTCHAYIVRLYSLTQHHN